MSDRRRSLQVVGLIAVVLVSAAAGFATRTLLDRQEQVTKGRELRVLPPAGPEVTGAVEVRATDALDPGQRSFQAIMPGRRPDEIHPPAMVSCERLMEWAQDQGGIVLGGPVLDATITAKRHFRVQRLRPSVINRDQPTGVFLSCHFIRYDQTDYRWPTIGLPAQDIPPEFAPRDSIEDEETKEIVWYTEFRLDPSDCPNCSYELLATLRMRDDGTTQEVAITGPDNTPLRVGAYQSRRVPDLTWCEEMTTHDIDGDDIPESQLRQADYQDVTTTDRCGITPLRG